mmetsp:Transcript_36388/g.95943  ORF Transcript_36388/g.95943 Transcript_36388/m.95943 type:complete len:325 (-) Transcript_36388:300-1274(-)|eukprot:CAMPEP_0115853726 /NCGR_PEP_ID=MMETSP0287-20121206/13653_1 /TAXON_ID=412157 /ORGANISM="Chrysochromulina rotalis, Strain UIO044" /LENGTH=324 /DNA_ID=CAMNT_0003307813 /DNA_START=150 /DNA_END=1124 /DNA_ORIENTATION=+
MSATEISDIEKCGWTLAIDGKEPGKELGSGHFAKVRMAQRKSDGLKAACKIIKKPKDLKKKAMVGEEHKILTKVTHPYVVSCYEAFETDDRMYLFLELMTGGELFDRIVDMGHFTEAQAKDVTFKLLSALDYMHKQGVAHRDLKPENMLMTSKDKDAEVKITDFGLSKFFDEQSTVMKTPCGTPGYIAPEVLHMKGYDKQCDVWSLGVIVYILLCGFPPFYADNDAQLFDRIKKGKYEFLKPYWDPVSDGAKNFIRRMLVCDPKERATCAQLMEDEWLKEPAAAAAAQLSTSAEITPSQQNLRKLKGAFLAAWVASSHMGEETA